MTKYCVSKFGDWLCLDFKVRNAAIVLAVFLLSLGNESYYLKFTSTQAKTLLEALISGLQIKKLPGPSEAVDIFFQKCLKRGSANVGRHLLNTRSVRNNKFV